MRTEEYLETLTGQIRCKLARGPIREEIRCHIEDQRDAYIEAGMSEAEAETAAVLEMGDPVKTGEEFDRIHRPQMPWKMIGLIIMISLAGFALQYLTMGQSSGKYECSVDFRRQFLFLVTGFGVMIAVCYLDYSRMVSKSNQIFIWMQFFLTLGKNSFGLEVNGQQQWIYISIFSLSINLTSLVLLFVPVFAMMLCEIRGKKYLDLILTAALMSCPLGLMYAVPSISTMFVLFASFSFLLTLTVWKGWFRVSNARVLIVYWGAIAAAAGWILYNIINAPHAGTRFHRLFGLGESVSYQMEVLRKMLRGACWIGRGTFQGEDVLSYADYLLAYIINRHGIMAGAAIIMVLLGLIILLYQKSFAQKNYSGMLTGVSCATVFLAELILYLLSNLGIVNTAGYCPFLTYGGTGILTTSVLLGILLSVFRYESVMSLYATKSPEDYEVKQKEWKYAEQLRILVIVFVLLAILMYTG